jgi:hypothetical protein
MTQEALKLALEAMTYADACLKKQLTTKDKHEYAQNLLLEAGNAIKEALAQPEQEPVAYINVEKRKLEWAKPMRWNTPTTVKLERIPLYTHSQRTWVGLTDEEFNELYDKYVPEACYALLIEKVEAKLKDKNS